MDGGHETWARWRWLKRSVLHARDIHRDPECDGVVHSHTYRYHPPGSPLYERCVGLTWCSRCRTYAGAMVRVPSDRALPDPLVGLGEPERSRVLRSETRLLDHLDRLARRGLWPPR